MTGMTLYGQPSPTQLSTAIDYPAALALRRMAQAHGDMPEYLLAVEVGALLHYLPDLYQQTCIDTLWNTGARINEGLALTRADFSLTSPYPYVSLATLKQRQEKAARGPGAPSKRRSPTGWSRCPITIISTGSTA